MHNQHFEGESHVCQGRHHGEFGGPNPSLHYPPDLELEPTHIAIHITLDIPHRSALLDVTHTLRAHRSGARSLSFDGVDFRDITAVDPDGKALSHAYDGRKLRVTWEAPFQGDEVRKVQFTYRVEGPSSGLFFMLPDEDAPQRPIYAATDHETERARHWLACLDLPNVRTTFEFHITADSQLTILAGGRLVSEEDHGDGTKTAHWLLEQRCPSYLACFAVGQFIRYNDTPHANIPIAYFATGEFTAEDLQRSFGRTPEIMAWMTTKLGMPFPYPKYFQFALPAFYGAMENISLVSWTDELVATPRHGLEQLWLIDQFNVHEMAHSYFGDLVVCRDFSHAWLKEAWATYMEQCWLEDRHGANEQFYDLWCNAQRYIDEADGSYTRPLVTRSFTSSWQMYDAHLYPGGAWRMHMLRHELGDAIFWPAVREYLARYREQVVETDDFRKVMEGASGRSLQKFFDQWVYGRGYPQLKVSFSYDQEKRVGTFEVEQKQVDEKKDIRSFEFTTSLSWSIAGLEEKHLIQVDKARQTFTFAMAKDPDMVRFDPEARLLHKLDFDPGEHRCSRQLTSAVDVIGRIQAAYVLTKSGRRSSLATVTKAFAEEPFWGVRRELARAIGETKTTLGLEALLAAIDRETDGRVQERIFQALALYQDPRIGEQVLRRLERGDLVPSAATAALTTLGAQREQAPVAALFKFAETEQSVQGRERRAALRALGMSRREDAVEFLLARVDRKMSSHRVRSGAVEGLGFISPYLEKRPRKVVEDRLIQLLRDPDHWIRQVSAQSLGRGRHRDAIGDLEAYRKTLAAQEQPPIDAIIKSLREQADDRVAASEKQLEELNEKLRKMQDRLLELEAKVERLGI